MNGTDNIRFECCLDENNGIKYRVFRHMWSALKRKGANLMKQDWLAKNLLHLIGYRVAYTCCVLFLTFPQHWPRIEVAFITSVAWQSFGGSEISIVAHTPCAQLEGCFSRLGVLSQKTTFPELAACPQSVHFYWFQWEKIVD